MTVFKGQNHTINIGSEGLRHIAIKICLQYFRILCHNITRPSGKEGSDISTRGHSIAQPLRGVFATFQGDFKAAPWSWVSRAVHVFYVLANVCRL